ncbi:Crp/Fnr family transcriptional regulator [Candidatus Daviesbacteria bacterium]|nr:Crp/Fnr family transcriptional regulator [Candidatus Daviesbacteria bacterium]
MNRKLWYLKQLNLFKELPEKEIKIISERFAEKEYSKRQVIFEPQDRNKVFILKKGRVEIYEITPDGKKIIIDILEPGNVFGDLGINEPNEYFVEATTNSFVCVMGKDEFISMVINNQKIASFLIKELFTKVVESEKQIAALASDNLLIKVKNLLLRLAKKYGEQKENKIIINSKFTHEKLAEMIGVSRQTMTEMLNKLERQGIVQRKNKIISFDPQKLNGL